MKRWPTKPLGELCSVVAGGTPSRARSDFYGGEIPWVKIGDMLQGTVNKTEETISQLGLENSAAKILPAGTVLISIFATIGRTAVLGIDATTNQAIAGVTPNNLREITPSFLRFFLDCSVANLTAEARGVAQMNINGKILKSLPIPVPPLAEQERIVKLLDEADELRKLRAQADRRTAQLLPALFHQMFGGSKFKPVRVGELTSLVTSGSTPRGGNEVYVSEGPYFIRSQNVRMNQFDLSDAVCLPAEVHEQMARTKVAKGDVLLNITGASIGRVAWVEKLDREANVSQHVCLIRPKPELLSAVYLSVFISLPATQYFILQIQAGASRQALNHQQVRALEIPVPSLPMQKEFAQRVTEIRALESAQAASRLRLESLFQSLLHRAFNGEL